MVPAPAQMEPALAHMETAQDQMELVLVQQALPPPEMVTLVQTSALKVLEGAYQASNQSPLVRVKQAETI